MFVVPDEVPSLEDEEAVLSGEGELMALKPMNCPAMFRFSNRALKATAIFRYVWLSLVVVTERAAWRFTWFDAR